jgi:hypothetical protein
VNAPPWLAEEPWLCKLLHWFLDKLDAPRTRPVTRRVKPATIPALFEFSQDTRYRWQLVEKLAVEFRVFTIKYDVHRGNSQERYENAQLQLHPDCEDQLRTWLDRPREDPVLVAWRDAVAPHAAQFTDGGASLFFTRPGMEAFTPADLVAAFVEAGTLLDHGLSLREISARCFGGHSKFLDTRADLLHHLFGERAKGMAPRPLLLTAWAPQAFEQLLIVENQDNFLRLVDAPPPGYALLYSAGFRASAGRLASGHTRFAFMPHSDSDGFYARWLQPDLPVWFWGDLDFTGLGILKALRGTFPHVRAWQPGYALLLERLLANASHTAAAAAKDGQQDPGITGCSYADDVLLPALRATKRYVDQEAVRP